MQHYGDMVSAAIINSHMRGGGLHLPEPPPQTELALISTQNEVVYGSLLQDFRAVKNDLDGIVGQAIGAVGVNYSVA